MSAPKRTTASYLYRIGKAVIHWVTKSGGPHRFLANGKQLLVSALRFDGASDSVLRGKSSLVLVRRHTHSVQIFTCKSFVLQITNLRISQRIPKFLNNWLRPLALSQLDYSWKDRYQHFYKISRYFAGFISTYD